MDKSSMNILNDQDLLADIMNTQPQHSVSRKKKVAAASISPAESLRQQAEAFQKSMAILLAGQMPKVSAAPAAPALPKTPARLPVRATGTDRHVFANYAWDWFEKFKVPKLRPGTAMNYRLIIRKHLVPFFGEMRLEEITTMDIQSFYNQHSDMAHSSVRCMGIVLHGIFESAIEDGLCTTDPTRSKRLTMSRKKVTREALSLEDAQDIINHLDRLELKDKVLVALLIFTGIRRGEALGLQWSDIDYDRKVIHIQRSVRHVGNRGYIGPTKSSAGVRMIPLEPQLERILLECKPSGTYVLGNGEFPITEMTYKRGWERICRTINMHGATAHVLRHTYITMAAAHLDIKTLQTIASHADISTTMNRYAHGREDKIIEAGGLLRNMYGS